MDEDQSGGIVLNDLDRLARGDELNAKRATEEAARLARAADKSLRLRDEFNLTRYMFQRGSVDWDPLDPKCQKRAVTKGNMREFITKIGLSSRLARSSYRRALTMSGEKKLNSVAGLRLAAIFIAFLSLSR